MLLLLQTVPVEFFFSSHIFFTFPDELMPGRPTINRSLRSRMMHNLIRFPSIPVVATAMGGAKLLRFSDPKVRKSAPRGPAAPPDGSHRRADYLIAARRCRIEGGRRRRRHSRGPRSSVQPSVVGTATRVVRGPRGRTAGPAGRKRHHRGPAAEIGSRWAGRTARGGDRISSPGSAGDDTRRP